MAFFHRIGLLFLIIKANLMTEQMPITQVWLELLEIN